jgi:hypothetical protein
LNDGKGEGGAGRALALYSRGGGFYSSLPFMGRRLGAIARVCRVCFNLHGIIDKVRPLSLFTAVSLPITVFIHFSVHIFNIFAGRKLIVASHRVAPRYHHNRKSHRISASPGGLCTVENLQIELTCWPSIFRPGSPRAHFAVLPLFDRHRHKEAAVLLSAELLFQSQSESPK